MIGFAGLSHLGIVSAVVAAAKGHQVIAFDPDSALCEKLSDGRLPIWEPQLPELLEANRSQILITSDPTQLSQCQLIYFSLDVPTDETGLTNLAPLNQLIDLIAVHASKGAILVVLSQVPPGFTRGLSDRICLQTSSKQLVLFCPYRFL